MNALIILVPAEKSIANFDHSWNNFAKMLAMHAAFKGHHMKYLGAFRLSIEKHNRIVF